MDNISEIMEKIRGYAADADLKTVMQAYLLAARAHAGQTRKSGEPYLSHPLAVAMILVDMRMDVDTVATALLHDALEDNPITKKEMAREIIYLLKPLAKIRNFLLFTEQCKLMKKL